MHHFDTLLAIARRKNVIDQASSWANGSATYLAEIRKEIDEVTEEIPLGRRPYLEDELADVLWDYLNVMLCLESEAGVNVDAVLVRACRKYEQRIGGIAAGEGWQAIKERQKAALAAELSQLQTDSGTNTG